MQRSLAVLALLAANLSASTEDPPSKYEVVSPKDDGIIAVDINDRGDLLGLEWTEERGLPDVLSQVPFLAKGKEQVTIPLLDGYTATFPAAVSDGGLVVGRVGRPPSPPGKAGPPRTQAFAWDEAGGIRGLGTVEGDRSSSASGVGRDGDRISGYSIGDNRMRACVWDRDGEGWKATALPHEVGLGSNVVAISGDGRRIAALDGKVPCLWTLGAGGAWAREPIGEAGSIVPRAVNDAGTVVGLQIDPDGNAHAAVWTRDGGLVRPEEPEGYARSEASAVNEAGVVVGMIDGPAGSEVGPRAFAYEKGRLRLLDEGGPNFTAATAINDRGQVAGVMEKPEPR